MHVYVAARETDLSTAASYVQAVEALGHEITHDWVADMMANPTPDDDALQGFAVSNVRGIRNAQAVVLFGRPTQKCLVELGVALSRGVPIIWRINNPSEEQALFMRHWVVIPATTNQHLEYALEVGARFARR